MKIRIMRPLAVIAAILLSACSVPAGAPPTSPSLAPTPSASSLPLEVVGSASPMATIPPDAFWTGLFSGEPDVVNYPSMRGLVKASDAVVLAALAGVSAGPSYDDSYGNTSYYATVTLQVERSLHGGPKLAADTLPVIVFLGAGPVGVTENPYGDFIGVMKASMPKERGVFFLVNVADHDMRITGQSTSRYDPSLYQVASVQGLLREVNGVARPPSKAPGAWAKSIAGRPFDDVIAEVAAAD